MSSAHVCFGELAEVRDEVEPEPLSSPRERHSTEEDDEEQQVGECGGEIDHLQRGKKVTCCLPGNRLSKNNSFFLSM